MTMLPSEIQQKCQAIIGADIRSAVPMTGGDISQALLLETDKGRFFLKFNSSPNAANMFEADAAGLALLASANALQTPAVLGLGATPAGGFLLLEYMESGYRPSGFWEEFGSSLAQLHRNTASNFGLGHDNFIGSLPQPNCQHDNWPDFFVQERLLPQLDIAKQRNRLQSADFQAFERLFNRLPEHFPAEPPALTHGDLWSGNFLCGSNGNPIIFDPAASFAHREMDLAMSRLFGGFDRLFYRSYEEAWPLVPGFEQRLPIYQLYYLLVHVNLFGGGYVGSVRSALQPFI